MKLTSKLILAGLALTTIHAQAAIVYEDAFDNDGLATNAGTGGGLNSFTIRDNFFTDDGSLRAGTNTNAARRTVASTINAFNLSVGATIEIHWEGNTDKTGYYDFSLTTSQLTSSLPATTGEGIFTQGTGLNTGDNASSRKGIGLAWGSFKNDGLYYNDGLAGGASVTAVDVPGGAFAASGNVIMELTVNSNLSWSYKINGTTIDSGSDISGGDGFDLSSVYLNFYAQPTAQFNYAKITTIPEPGAALLGGLGLLALLRRRRNG